MAHRSAASPDQKWVLLAEMDNGLWTPCRIVPLDGTSVGRLVGPQGAQCTYAAWPPDGRWMYFTANAGNGFHVWRQRHPDGEPEQLTHGPTEEEGIAVAPDGKSFITAAGVRLNSIRLLDDSGERPISEEGLALFPRGSRDGERVFFISLTGGAGGAYLSGNLVLVTLADGTREQILPDHPMQHFDLSADDRQVLFVAASTDSTRQGLWVAPLDRMQAPRRVFDGPTDRAFFDPADNIYFLKADGRGRFLHRLRAPDYTVNERVATEQVFHLFSTSPDGEWAAAISTADATSGG
jgi:Tol biopolymer transport system component